MKNKQAIEVLNTYDMSEDNEDKEFIEAVKIAIKAIENINHLKDRPCSVCEFRKENGCCKWDCVFD